MQNPPKSQSFVRARALQYSRLRSAGHTKCNCALRAQTKLMVSMVNNYSGQFWVQMATIIPKIDHYEC